MTHYRCALLTVVVLSQISILDGSNAETVKSIENQKSQTIRWHSSYADARKEAVKKKLPLLFMFYYPGSAWSVMQEAEMQKDPAIVDLLNKKFVALKLLSKPDRHYLIDALHIAYYPTIIIASYDGKILGTIEGFHNPKKLHDRIKKALAGMNSPQGR